MTTSPLFLGVDIGTQGVRALAVTATGEVVARGARPLPVPPAGPVQEQRPEDWWAAVVAAVVDLGEARGRVAAVAVSCTSGSVCAIDAAGHPVAPGLLYADRRALTSAGADASWAVAKIAWLVAERPDTVARTSSFTSPGGHVASRLVGRPAPIDVTQALKFGFDPEAWRWGPSPVPHAQLPDVVATGDELGPLDREAAAATGLPPDAVVVAGATDGVAGQIACRPSPTRWTTSIGSTIVWKAVSSSRIDAPGHGVYSHRGPDGLWLPGGASNAGARALSTWATAEDLARYDATVAVTPATSPAYPSELTGERFPFLDPGFRPWAPPPPGPERWAAQVLGAALVERWGCEVLVAHGCEAPAVVATTGGAAASRSWSRLRADVLGVPVEVPSEASSAFGAAVIAAGHRHGGVLAAADAMVRTSASFEPAPGAVGRWDEAYERFRRRCLDHSEEAP